MKHRLMITGVFILLAAVLLSACGGNQAAVNEPTPIENDQAEGANSADEPIEENTTETEPVEEPEPEPAPTLELTDALGTTLTFEAPFQRIVSLAPSVTETLFAIGAGDQVVGREDFTNYPEEALALPSIGGNFGELNTEAILALEPDLIIAAPLTTAEQVQSLNDVGLTVFMLENPVTLDEMYDVLRTAAVLTGHEAETEELIASLQARVAAVEETIAQAETTPLVFYELDSTEPSAPWTAGPNTFIDTLITMAGGENLAGEMEGAWVQVSSEELVAQNPEVIILGDYIWGITPEMVAERPGWEAIDAVANGRVYPFNDDLASRPGPRLVDGLEELARLIHPELYE